MNGNGFEWGVLIYEILILWVPIYGFISLRRRVKQRELTKTRGFLYYSGFAISPVVMYTGLVGLDEVFNTAIISVGLGRGFVLLVLIGIIVWLIALIIFGIALACISNPELSPNQANPVELLQLEQNLERLKKKNSHLQNKLEYTSKDISALTQKRNTLIEDKQKLLNSQVELNNQISQLNSELVEKRAEVIKLQARKQAESLGDYEKSENYQIISEYEIFCTKSDWERVCKNISNYFYSTKGIDRVEIRKLLSDLYIVKAHQIQLSQFLKRQSFITFSAFTEDYVEKSFFFDLPVELQDELQKTADQLFSWIIRLFEVSPPCYLFFAKNGENFDTDIHQLAIGYSGESTISFTVIPGILSGHQLLMKPVVVTQCN